MCDCEYCCCEDCDCRRCEDAREAKALKALMERWNWNATPREIADEIESGDLYFDADTILRAHREFFGEKAMWSVVEASLDLDVPSEVYDSTDD